MTPCVLLFVDHPRRQESHQRTPLFFEPEVKQLFVWFIHWTSSQSYVQFLVDLFIGVADVFLKLLPLEAKLLGAHHHSTRRLQAGFPLSEGSSLWSAAVAPPGSEITETYHLCPSSDCCCWLFCCWWIKCCQRNIIGQIFDLACCHATRKQSKSDLKTGATYIITCKFLAAIFQETVFDQKVIYCHQDYMYLWFWHIDHHTVCIQTPDFQPFDLGWLND